jgi:hypothetical protein
MLDSTTRFWWCHELIKCIARRIIVILLRCHAVGSCPGLDNSVSQWTYCGPEVRKTVEPVDKDIPKTSDLIRLIAALVENPSQQGPCSTRIALSLGTGRYSKNASIWSDQTHPK